jgi:hypothetical protein
MSLLDKARAANSKVDSPITNEHIELALAYLAGEVSFTMCF